MSAHLPLQDPFMPSTRTDILALGNAIVDVIAQTPADFIATHKLTKGAMTLIEEGPAEALYAAMGDTQVISGGSAANTVIGAANLGCTATFIGKVRDDELGALFKTDIERAGVAFPVAHATSGPTTARCLIMVTPDGDRTMNTFLGACQDLTADDVDPATVAAAKIVYLEGYLWDPPHAKEAFVKAAEIAHQGDGRVALSLSDAFCVGRYRAEFLDLIRLGKVDILFANETELASLYEEPDFDAAVAQLGKEGILAAVTRGEHGCVVVSPDGRQGVPAAPIDKLVDTTGAGDLFAAGFVTGLVRGFDHVTCARLGGLAAAEIIQHIGARPKADLRQLAAAAGIAV
ncbi:Adenosine kinase [Beijerinckiaceae bacterium RH AL1]|nr:Adenosine kinase [Beijerinckiaceae bacterium RH AL8]VVB42120.1 Adenosine kinase [Beijerinckiaceae bacterium RH CH11]VVC53147.1 Adenosine kinase [Beijerinckiaceae bacterium RH AL1]